MTEEKGLEEGQDGSPQPWTILPRGVIGVGPAEKLEASPGFECAGSLETKQKDLDLMGGEIGTLLVP